MVVLLRVSSGLSIPLLVRLTWRGSATAPLPLALVELCPPQDILGRVLSRIGEELLVRQDANQVFRHLRVQKCGDRQSAESLYLRMPGSHTVKNSSWLTSSASTIAMLFKLSSFDGSLPRA